MKSGHGVFIIILFVIFASVSYAGDKTLAYLDPGIGAMIFQMLIAGFVGLLFAIKLFWRNIKGFFATVFGGIQNSEGWDLFQVWRDDYGKIAGTVQSPVKRHFKASALEIRWRVSSGSIKKG